MVLAHFSCWYHASRYRARARAPKRCLLKGCFGARARARYLDTTTTTRNLRTNNINNNNDNNENNNNNNKKSKNQQHQQQQQQEIEEPNNNNNNNNKDSKNHQQQQSWLVPWGIAGFAKPINMFLVAPAHPWELCPESRHNTLIPSNLFEVHQKVSKKAFAPTKQWHPNFRVKSWLEC